MVADPELVREDAVFADPAEELGYAILNKTGDREAKLEFEPPPPGTALRAAGVASAVAARSPRHRAVRGLCDNCLMPLAPGLACRWISSRRCRKVT